jgi:hypothetical protein
MLGIHAMHIKVAETAVPQYCVDWAVSATLAPALGEESVGGLGGMFDCWGRR